MVILTPSSVLPLQPGSKMEKGRRRGHPLSYVAGVTERVRVCRGFNIRVVFKSGSTLRSLLTRVKDLSPGRRNLQSTMYLWKGVHQRDCMSARNISEGVQTRYTHKHTHTQTKYHNPSALALRVNKQTLLRIAARVQLSEAHGLTLELGPYPCLRKRYY